MTLCELLKLKYPDINFFTDTRVMSDEDGVDYIAQWNRVETIPSQEDLDNWAIEFDLAHRQQQAVRQRVYPSIGDQLDMIYKDMKANTKTWVDAIDAIKAAHPKPTE